MKKPEETMPEKLERMVFEDYPTIIEDYELKAKLLEDHIAIPELCVFSEGLCGMAMMERDQQLLSVITSGKDSYMADCKIAIVSAVLTWRLHKVIYDFDKDLAEELEPCETGEIKIPEEIIKHKPYPCIYIRGLPELPHVDGAFFYLDYDMCKSNNMELNVLYCFRKGGVFTYHWRFVDGFCNGRDLYIVPECEAAIASSSDYLHKAGPCLERALQHLNMFLYLCSEEPDITRDAPLPRIKGEGVLRRAARIDVAHVGRYIGAKMRTAKAAKKVNCGNGVHNIMPHMRRAHWCLYWTGKGRKTPKLIWLAPIFVNGRGNDVPVSIHGVE